MDYMDAWDGKKLVDSSLEKVCVSIFKISYFLQLLCLLSLNMLLIFALLTCCFHYVFFPGVSARVQETHCCTTASIPTQCGQAR
jgi:hypothetical protein